MPKRLHVPTDGEWMTMEMALGMSEAEANDNGWRGTDQGKLKSAFWVVRFRQWHKFERLFGLQRSTPLATSTALDSTELLVEFLCVDMFRPVVGGQKTHGSTCTIDVEDVFRYDYF